MNAINILLGFVVFFSFLFLVTITTRDEKNEIVVKYIFDDRKFLNKDIMEIKIYKINSKLIYNDASVLDKEKYTKTVLNDLNSIKFWKILNDRLNISSIPADLSYDNQNFQLIIKNKNGEITTILITQIFYSSDSESAYATAISGLNNSDKWAVRMNRKDIVSLGIEWRPFGANIANERDDVSRSPEGSPLE